LQRLDEREATVSHPDERAHEPDVVDRPGAVTVAVVIAVIHAALQVVGVFVLLAVGGAMAYVFLVIAVASIVLYLWGGFAAMLGSTNKILGYTALVLALFNSVTSIIKGFTEIFDGPSMIGPGYWGVVLPAAIVALLRRPAAKEFFAARGGTSW
jgi:hypothetical protein